MPARPFVHLHCHTHYSLLDGASRIPELVAHVKSLGMNSVAITDHGNLYGAIEFYRECKAGGINPIVGYEAYVAPGKRTEREAKRRGDAGYHLTLLAYNRTGFKNLVKMSSIAFIEGYYYVPRIDKELLEAHKEGLICLSGCASAEFSEFILKEDLAGARKVAEWFQRVFGENFYIEIQNNGLRIQRQCAEGAIHIANQMGLPLVATSDAHYLKREDASAHDVLLCINTGRTLNDPNRMRYGEDNKLYDLFYVRGPEEMYQLFPEHDTAVKRTQEIADRCAIDLDFKTRHFPVFTPPGKKKPEDYLRELCEKGLIERYGEDPPKTARDRLEHELGIICRMGFASYFLIVWDFVRFAIENNIPASARGSACGAVVSYVLKLSHVDPLEYDLLFERFLDPNRSEAPDIDIDFCQERREEVIAYVKHKYGEQSVAQIATFGTLAAKAAVKDVGRALDIPLERVNRITALIPSKPPGITIDDAMGMEQEFRRLYETDPEVKQLIDIAKKLEGTNRQSGIHAAGVVIANGPITDYVPVHRAVRKGEDAGSRGGEPVIATQWVMGDLEKVGMLKMDFLGLRTLTLLDNAVKLIEKTRGEVIDLYNLPIDDPETYALLQSGDAKGVFQLESDGIRELLKRLKPDNIRDLIAIMALYRPGPLGGGMVDAYINRKHGREPIPQVHPIMDRILANTYGVITYQEQCMQVLNQLGGIELASAYACIKAISKKKQEIIDARRADFLKGAQDRGVSKEVAEEIFSLIVFFGGYGFNGSHAAAYALIGYQTAYLKAHYTPEFMAALLSSEIDDGNKRDIMVQHIADAKHFGVEVVPPDVNASDGLFTVVAGRILFGLTAIKGLGHGAAAEIVRAREESGPFKDFFNFCERVDNRIVSKSAIEKLIKAGACDRFGRRSQLMHVLPRAVQAAQEAHEDRRRGQRNLFAADTEEIAHETASAALPDIPEWPELERLKFEKEALDLYLSSHPLAQYEDDVRRFSTTSVGEILGGRVPVGQEIIIAGMFSEVRFMNTKRARNGNSRFVRCKLVDFTGALECLMWPDEFVRHKDDFVEDSVCFVKGTVERAREEPSLVLTRVFSVEQARRERARDLVLVLSLGVHSAEHIDAVSRVLQRSPGSCRVYLSVRDGAGYRCLLQLSKEFWVDASRLSVGELETILGPNRVKFSGPVPAAGRN